MKRPAGVVVIGILAIIGAVLDILGSLALLGVGGLASATGAGGIGAGVLAVGVIYLIIGVVMLIFAISFLGLKPWAWWGLLVLEVISVVWGIIGLVVNGFTPSTLIGIIIQLLIILYLMSKNVKAAFFGPKATVG